mmetsp:Transcript_11499/g.22585  ORF Transcript_11499/g.22585 Transcript_11499/m.22585 type:complete len:226 (+) Transcript_11499:839-1516(+)
MLLRNGAPRQQHHRILLLRSLWSDPDDRGSHRVALRLNEPVRSSMGWDDLRLLLHEMGNDWTQVCPRGSHVRGGYLPGSVLAHADSCGRHCHDDHLFALRAVGRGLHLWHRALRRPEKHWRSLRFRWSWRQHRCCYLGLSVPRHTQLRRRIPDSRMHRVRRGHPRHSNDMGRGYFSQERVHRFDSGGIDKRRQRRKNAGWKELGGRTASRCKPRLIRSSDSAQVR